MQNQLIEVVVPSYLLAPEPVDLRWKRGPFNDLKALPPKAKGKRFERIVDFICRHAGYKVNGANDTDFDRRIGDKRTEIKGSTVTRGTDDWFSFLQIRPGQDYDQLVLAAFWFDGRVSLFRVPKVEIVGLINSEVLRPQHGGNRGGRDTYCYNGNLEPFKRFAWFDARVEKGPGGVEGTA
jgi:hypothetical protein